MAGARDFLGRGFSFPPAVDAVTGRFRMAELEEDIRQSIYIILMTRKGERPMRPEFGCTLHDYVFELPDRHAVTLITGSVLEALTQWEPRIVDTAVGIDTSGLHAGKIVLNISYTVRDTNNPNNLVFPYYLYEGVGIE